MLFLERYIFLFLWLSQIKCDNIQSIVNTVKINKKNEIEFSLLKLKYNILFNPEKNQKKIHIDYNQVNAFYLVLSCSFSEQTMSFTHNLITDVPLFYSHTFLNSDYKNLLTNNKDYLSIKLLQIEGIIKQFITLNKNYLNKVLTPNLLYYSDNDILRTFVSLYIKINILQLDDLELNHTDMNDMIIIREILKEINAIQIFLSMNCDNSDKDIKKIYTSIFYGYTVIRQDVNWSSNVSTIFNNLEADHCSIKKIFLHDFLENESMVSDLEHDISNSTVNIFNENNVKIKDFFKQIRSTYDINAIYWYMKSILATIMKLLFSRIIEGIQKRYLTRDIINSFSGTLFLYDNAKEDKKDIPIDLYEGFKLLKNNRNNYYDENRYEKLINDLYTFYSNIKPNISLVKYYNIEPLDIQNMSSKDEDYNKTTLKNEESEFQKYMLYFLDKIFQNQENFECFGEYLKYLENPINKQYLPSHILKPKQIKSIDEDKYLDECYFIMDIYHISIKSDIFVNKSKYQKIDPNCSNESTLLTARNIINFIRDKFVMYLKSNRNNLKLNEVVKDIVIIMENLPPTKQILEIAFLKRIIYLINAKLNSWGLEYCSQPKFNFLFFNNIHLIKDEENDSEKIDFYNNTSFFSNFRNIIETEDYRCFSFKYFHDKFIEENEIVKNYSTVISLKWNNKIESIKTVYSNLSNLFFKSHYLYISHEIYYIFHIAAYLHGLRIIFNAYNKYGNKNDIQFDQNELKVDKDREICPKYLSGLFYEILKLKKKLYEKSIDNTTTYNEELNYIQKNIEQFNIVFPDEKKSKKKKSILSKLESINSKINDFNNKTKKIVNGMSALYTKCYEITQFSYNKTSPTQSVMRKDSESTNVSMSESEDDEEYLIK